jgi:ribose transport system substrate-binding protein
MSRKRLVIWTTVAVVVIAGMTYRNRINQEPQLPMPKVTFVTGGSGPYWQSTIDGAKAAAKKNRVKLDVKAPSEDENVEQQMMILGQLDPSDFDGLAISPLDAEGQSAVINKWVNGNKKVVTFDSDAPLSARQSHVGTSNFTAGRICANVVAKVIPDGGKVAVLLASLTKDNTSDRKGGFQERINQLADDVPEGGALKYQVVDYRVDNGNAAACEKNIRELVAAHPDLAVIVGMNAQHGPVLINVLKALDKLDKIKLVTFDDAEETLNGVEDGHIYATLAQDPFLFGYEAVTTLANICGGDETAAPIVGRGSTYLSVEVVQKENLEDFRNRLKSRQKQIAASTK